MAGKAKLSDVYRSMELVYLYLAFETNWPFGQIKAKKGHTAPPEELEYTREAGVF